MKVIPKLLESSVQHFRKHAFDAAVPRRLPSGLFKAQLPAISHWFVRDQPTGSLTLNADYFAKHENFAVPVEITSPSSKHEDADPVSGFARVDMLLSQFIMVTQSATPKHTLYIAQCPLASLSATLQADLPTPSLVRKSGRGDVYDSSLWLGLSPTYTPLHRDPNPNLFVQLAGRKVVRIFEPHVGRAVFEEAQRRVGGEASAAFRGEEMMAGAEREVLEALVWGKEGVIEEHVHEAEVESGDGLFIPRGWWHSIKGIGQGINGSANWWFR